MHDGRRERGRKTDIERWIGVHIGGVSEIVRGREGESERDGRKGVRRRTFNYQYHGDYLIYLAHPVCDWMKYFISFNQHCDWLTYLISLTQHHDWLIYLSPGTVIV